VLFLVAALVLSLAAPAVAKGRNNKGSASPTLTVSAMDSGATLLRSGALPQGPMMVEGDGYVNETAILVKFYPMDTGYLTDADGTAFGFEWTPPGPGTYTLVAWQVTKRGKWEKAAETTVDIAG
jgi:hypothetical protein